LGLTTVPATRNNNLLLFCSSPDESEREHEKKTFCLFHNFTNEIKIKKKFIPAVFVSISMKVNTVNVEHEERGWKIVNVR
jgi:hypothetical protein